jgi:hypothetical protein
MQNNMYKTKKDKSGYMARANQFALEVKNGLSKKAKEENEKSKQLMQTLFS